MQLCGPQVVHGGAEEEWRGADLPDFLEELRHAGAVGVEECRLEGFRGAIIHAEQDGHIVRPVGRDVGFEPRQCIGHRVAAHAGIVKVQPLPRVARIEIILHVLRVETLRRDAIPQENKAIAVGGDELLEWLRLFRHGERAAAEE